jgi:hypothetical protein
LRAVGGFEAGFNYCLPKIGHASHMEKSCGSWSAKKDSHGKYTITFNTLPLNK